MQARGTRLALDFNAHERCPMHSRSQTSVCHHASSQTAAAASALLSLTSARKARCSTARPAAALALGASIEEAMESFAAGDDAAFARVYALAAPRIFRMLNRLTREPALAEDITQDTLVRMYGSRDSYRPGAQVLPWAFTIARRLFVDRVRRRRSEQAFIASFAAGDAGEAARADEEIAARRMARVVADVLERLPRRQAEAFSLMKEDGLSLAEVCARLGDTSLSVRLRAHRACRAIRLALEEHGHISSAPRAERARAVQ
jgi:RNA polymerase sigma-70 factor, ECF subfamily